MTVSVVTVPPCPECLVITAVPSSASSAIGNPGAVMPGTSAKPEKLPPVACGPHSMTCPATTPAASRSQSPVPQPCHQAAGPAVNDASATRPQTTM